MSTENFHGCKLALLQGERVLVFRRDNKVGIPFPGMLDFPGGGCEKNETPEQCVLRELEEEFGLVFADDRLVYRRKYTIPDSDNEAFFFAGIISKDEIAAINFGSEGTDWQLMRIADYGVHPNAIPHLREMLLAVDPLQLVAKN